MSMENKSNKIRIQPENYESWYQQAMDRFGGVQTEYGLHIHNEKAQIDTVQLTYLKDITFYVSDVYLDEEYIVQENTNENPQILVRMLRKGEVTHLGRTSITIGKNERYGASMCSTNHRSDVVIPAKTRIQSFAAIIPVDHWILQAGNSLPEIRNYVLSEKPWLIHEELTFQMEQDLDRLFELIKLKDKFSLSYSTARCIDILTHFFVKVHARLQKSGMVDLLDVDTQILYQIKYDLDEHINNPPTLDELSEKYAMSVSKLSNNFKKAFGLRPKQYSVRLRLNEAKRKVEYSKDSLSKIAEELGYSDLAHLSSQYKKEFGETPTQTRERLLG